MPDGTKQRRLENTRLKLTSDIAELIKLRLIEYYSAELSGKEFPFGKANCKFLGVLFVDSILKSG
jgi:hypothetical protein